MEDKFALLYLQNPRECLYGITKNLLNSGVIFRGIGLDQIESFKYQFKADEHRVFFQTVFYPLQRVERIVLDEHQGELPSTTAEILKTSGLSEAELREM